jgi:hypothetical protein
VTVDATLAIEIPNDRFHRIPLFAGKLSLVSAGMDGTTPVILASTGTEAPFGGEDARQGFEKPQVQMLQNQLNAPPTSGRMNAVRGSRAVRSGPVARSAESLRASERSDFALVVRGAASSP